MSVALERDDDSKKSHRALVADNLPSRRGSGAFDAPAQACGITANECQQNRELNHD
jgi:hypothetical protein